MGASPDREIVLFVGNSVEQRGWMKRTNVRMLWEADLSSPLQKPLIDGDENRRNRRDVICRAPGELVPTSSSQSLREGWLYKVLRFARVNNVVDKAIPG
jgi:hypothetical protein